jgi:hypothetical protein
MAHRSSFARVLAAGGTPTANASAGGDIGSIVVGSVGVENKIKGVPTGSPFLFWPIATFCRIASTPAII